MGWSLIALPLTMWATGALAFAGGSAGVVPTKRKVAAVGYVFVVTSAPFLVDALLPAPALSAGARWAILATPLIGFVVVYLWFRAIAATNTRTWSADQARLPRAVFDPDGHHVTLHDVRDFRYRSPVDWDAAWYDATYDLRRLKRAYFIVEPFNEFEHAAHTMVSFEFVPDGIDGIDGSPSANAADPESRFVAISVEIRKEQGEDFSALRGLYRQYEIMYVVADERDAVQLRSNHRDDTVYVYPVAATPDAMRAYFVDMCERLNALIETPEYYNTATNTCTTNLVVHLRRASDKAALTYDPRVLMPAWSDQLVHRLGLIDTTGVPTTTEGRPTLGEVRAHFKINARALAAEGLHEFSRLIRAT